MTSPLEEHAGTRLKHNRPAPGRPGQKPTWTSGAKTAVGTALSAESRVWFTIGRGILNELYFPDVDCANTRSLRYVVTDDKRFFSDEELDTEHEVAWLQPGSTGFPHRQSL